jgi:CubicO group peptidase (beta-lactamase class C family)
VSMLEEVLAGIDGWPVDTVGIGVTSAGATLATHGEVDEVLAFASVTKPLAAYAVLIAVQDGAVHLDEPAGPDEAPSGITVRHLLAHASGLPLDAGGGPIGAPERKRIYSNWGFELLGALVEERVGLPFAEHLDVEVLQPLGMRDTSLDGSPAFAASGTVTDLLAFARELLRPTLLGDDLHATATGIVFEGLDGVVPGFGRQTPCDWGLGFEIKADKDPHWTGGALAPATFGHFGRSGSYLWVDPTRGLAAAELADRDFDAWAKEVWPPMNDAIVAAAEDR